MNNQESDNQEWLTEKGKVVEQPFSSDVPLFGPFIAWFRSAWNNVAARWYVQPLLNQQNEFNRLSVERLRDIETYTYDLASEQDHDLSRIRHDVAVLHMQMAQLNQRLEELNRQMQQIDETQPLSPEEKDV